MVASETKPLHQDIQARLALSTRFLAQYGITSIKAWSRGYSSSLSVFYA